MLKKIIRFVCSISLIISGSSFAATYSMPRNGDDVVGKVFVVEAHRGDTLLSIGNDFDIGYHEMMEANQGIDPRRIRVGQHIVIPTQYVLPNYRKGIVINLAELRIYYFTSDGKKVMTYPVGLGRRGWRTPLTKATVTRKKEDPTWYVPDSIRDFVFEQTGKILPDYIPPGPENPLGPYAIYLSKPGYLIHGTNQPWSIGKLISSGCIRMHNRDVEELFNTVKVGDAVHIIHHPYKIGWSQGVLFIEAHKPLALNEEPLGKLNILSVDKAIKTAIKRKDINISWDKVDQAEHETRGFPVPIGNSSFFSMNNGKHT